MAPSFFHRQQRGKTMRKLFTILALCVLMCLMSSGCVIADAGEKTNEEEIVSVGYDSNVDYMSLMIRYAAAGDMDALGAAVTARNEKIANQHLEHKQISVEEFLSDFESYAGFSLDVDYMDEMVSCCLSGNIQEGVSAEKARNLKIDALNLDTAKVSFNDLYLLSKIITSEAGSYWLSMEWKMMVGEVLLNRVASPEFPNSIEECIYQPGQYYSKSDKYFANLLPYESCVEAALRLLNGERIINDGSVVFQANFRQGSGTYLRLYDKQLGYTYLCYSSYPELYES